MNGEASSSPQTEARMVVGEATRYWWVLLISGVAWLIISWLVLRANVTSLATVGLLLGVMFILAAVNEAGFGTMVSGGWKVLHYVLSGLFVLAALWAFIRPINTFFALASVLGLILVVSGAFEIIRGVASRGENPYWWVGLISGVLLLLLAFWVSSSDREFALARRTYLLLFWVGFMALFRGISQIMLAFTVRHAHNLATSAAVSGAPDATGATGTVPPQERRTPAASEAKAESGAANLPTA